MKDTDRAREELGDGRKGDNSGNWAKGKVGERGVEGEYRVDWNAGVGESWGEVCCWVAGEEREVSVEEDCSLDADTAERDGEDWLV